MTADFTDYRPNVKLALSTIPTKWYTNGAPLEYMLDAADADLVIDSLLEHGWTIIPTEIAAAQEVVETSASPTEPTPLVGYHRPRFVHLGYRWFNPDNITCIEDDPHPEGGPSSCVVHTMDGGAWLTPGSAEAAVLAVAEREEPTDE